ncbi:MAG: helix-turn-helix transcriptional regulator [Myxococcales bacterium]|nr:helix-turn-helix transcriptional regulator [Myxococcales bacterium]
MSGKKLTVDELKRIGWRIRAVRALTGLSQEQFATLIDVPIMTIKGWELGRALPRDDSLRRVTDSMAEQNICVSLDWILHAEGSGPFFLKGTRSSLVKKDERIDSIDADNTEVAIAFKTRQRKIGQNPIVATLHETSPNYRFFKGDIVGAILVSKNVALEINKEHHYKYWLVPLSSDEDRWIIREIFFDNNDIFMKSPGTSDISKFGGSLIGIIKMHYRSGVHT